MSVTVVHLIRAANSVAHLRRFLVAYRKMRSGMAHELVLACKGFTPDSIHAIGPFCRGLTARILILPDTGFDLGTYRRVCFEISTPYICFVNSFSRPLTPHWLPLLYGVARRPEVGLSGATGSLQVDPHVRTNSFCIQRELYLDIVTSDPHTKEAACAIEAGPASLTRQVMRRGLSPRIVCRNGTDAALLDARDTRTFWWGQQENLLVSDNRTDDYDLADPARRAFLQRAAWHTTDPSSFRAARRSRVSK